MADSGVEAELFEDAIEDSEGGDFQRGFGVWGGGWFGLVGIFGVGLRDGEAGADSIVDGT
eukprot:565673-Amorphochlora_amoeboformis.AAC.2